MFIFLTVLIILYLFFYFTITSHKIFEKIIVENKIYSSGEIIGLIILKLFSKDNFNEYLQDTITFFKDMIRIIKGNKNDDNF